MSIDDLAAAALPHFGLSPEATATLCNVSENHTYRVEDPASPSGYALRVHRPGYRTAHQIESELQWVDALREDGAVDTCVPVRAPGGERVLNVHDHNVVLWEWLPGAEPDPEGDEVLDGFRVLARCPRACTRTHARGPRRTGSTARRGTTTTRSATRARGAAGRTGSGWGARSWRCSAASMR
jgi:Ser/Thr protein kinase RdoA (MazF antagonist)